MYGVCLDINTLNVQDMRVHCSKFLAAKISAIVLNTNSSQTMNQLLLKVLLTVVFVLSCIDLFVLMVLHRRTPRGIVMNCVSSKTSYRYDLCTVLCMTSVRCSVLAHPMLVLPSLAHNIFNNIRNNRVVFCLNQNQSCSCESCGVLGNKPSD